MTAPVALFVFNRPDHAERTLRALASNDLCAETDITIYCDGPRGPADTLLVEATRNVARAADGFRSVRVVERRENLGLAESIITGVTEICGSHGRIIVMEDDLVTAPGFLRFMNGALDKYESEPLVGSIHGYWYPVDTGVPETFFLRGASCWGWATWSRAWKVFDRDGARLLSELRRRKLTRAFDLDGAMAYTRMLEDQIAGRNNSWAIRWHASAFLAGLLQLSPGRSLVRNIGFDGTGTHCADSSVFDVALGVEAPRLADIPVAESPEARAALIRYYRSTRRPLWRRALGRVRRIAGRLAS